MSTSPWLNRPGSLIAHAGVLADPALTGTITGTATLQGDPASFTWSRSQSGEAWAALSRNGIDEARVSGGTGLGGVVTLTPASSGSYTARLYVAASGGPPIAETAAFAVTAAQVAPTSVTASAGTVAHDALAGSTVAILSAPGNTAPVTWSIVGGADAARFVIDGAALEVASDLTNVSPDDVLAVRVRATNAMGQHEADLSFVAYDPAAAQVLFERTAIGRGDAPGTVHTFAQVFARDRVPVGSAFVVQRADGTPMRTQFEPITFYEDAGGAPTHVKFALMAVQLPSLADGVSESLKFVRGASHPSPGPDIDLAAALASRNASVTITPTDAAGVANGTPFVLDLTTAVPAGRRRNGPLVSETRWNVAIPAASFGGQASGRLFVDAWVTSDGALFVDPWVGNIAFDFPDATATSIFCQMSVVIDGVTVFDKKGEVATLCGTVRYLLGRRAGAMANADPVWLMAATDEMYDAGLIPRYAIPATLDAGLTTAFALVDTPEWQTWTTDGSRKPLRRLIDGGPTGNNENLYGIPFGDAGSVVAGGSAAQFPSAWRYMVAQAEGMGAHGHFVWDLPAGRWLNNVDRPSFQTHGNRSYFKPASAQARSFMADGAHFPLVLVMPIVMTGRRSLADNLVAKIYSGNTYQNVEDAAGIRYASTPGGGQIRSIAYALCLQHGYWFTVPANEDHTVPGLAEYIFDKLLDYHIDNIPRLNALNGETAGQWEHTTINRHSFWQDALMASALALLARSGIAKAQTLLEWTHNFLVGIWQVNGVYGIPGAIYREAFTSADTLTTWAQLGTYSTIDNDPNGAVDSNYVREMRMALNSYAMAMPDDAAVQAACAKHDVYQAAETRLSSALTAASFAASPRQTHRRPVGFSVPDVTGV